MKDRIRAIIHKTENYNKLYDITKRWKYACFFIGCFIILIFNMRNIEILISPNILFDEFGYLSSGALFAGRDWSSVTSNFVTYYSYGYGLIISLVLICVQNATLAYQILILCNAIMICVVFVLSEYVCSSIISNVRVRIIICFALCFYPGIIHNTQFVWTETLLTFLFWVMLALLKSLVCNPTVFKSALFAIVSVYAYMVHQRCLGVLCAAIVAMTFMMFLKSANKKIFFTFIITIIATMMIHYVLKKYVQNHLWDYKGVAVLDVNPLQNEMNENVINRLNTNDYGGQIEKLLYIFTQEGFNCFLMGLFGKLFYFGVTSFFFGLEGIYYIISKTVEGLMGYKIGNFDVNKIYLLLFTTLSFVTTLFIAVVFHIYPGRIDTVLYGRYTDWIAPFPVIIGVYSVFSDKNNLKRLFVYISLIMLFLCFFNPFMSKYELWSNFATCSPITFVFRNNICNCEVEWVSVMFLTMTFISIILWRFISLKKISGCAFGIVLMILTWSVITNPAVNWDINMGNQEELMRIIETLKEDSDKKIYYVSDRKETPLYIGGMQYLLDYRSIKVIKPEQLMEVNEGILIFDSQSSNKKIIAEEFAHIESNDLCDIYINYK